MEEDRRFCVYEHIRKDTGTCFYVGKGTLKRAYNKSRNKHHDYVVNKYGMTVKIIADNLTQDEAYELERKTIQDYVFDKGYGIDIDGYRKPDSVTYLTNCTFGGEGSYGFVHTIEWREQHSKDMTGENNPMYGVNVWENYSEDKAKEIRNKLSESLSGENNPMYGISPKERMDEVTYQAWLQKQHDRPRNGADNPNYGNHVLKEFYSNNPELKQLLSRPGSQNGRARKVYVYDKDMNYINEFNYLGACAEWLNTFNKPVKIDSLRASIAKAIDSNKLYKNMYYFSEKL